eukprot:7412337-Prorocentrum_lima.AAC.1
MAGIDHLFDAQHRRAMKVVALHLDAGVNWDSRSDIITTRLLGTLYGDELRAHAEGVYLYDNGAWCRIEEIPEPILRDMELVLMRAQCLYQVLMTQEIERDWTAVFDALKEVDPNENFNPVLDCEWTNRHWAGVAGKELKHIPARFTSG